MLEDMEDWVEEVLQIYLLADLDLLCGDRTPLFTHNVHVA